MSRSRTAADRSSPSPKADRHGDSTTEPTRVTRAGRPGGVDRNGYAGRRRARPEKESPGQGPGGAAGAESAGEEGTAAHVRAVGRLRRRHEAGRDFRL